MGIEKFFFGFICGLGAAVIIAALAAPVPGVTEVKKQDRIEVGD